MLGGLVFAIILSVLIIVHEYGHYLAAKRAGIRVERFSIGFGPVLIKIKGKETEFVVSAIPLGGYVKMAGDSRIECKGNSYEFYSKPVGVRARVVFFGPLFNYFLAIIVFWIAFMVGFPSPDTYVGQILEGYPAQYSDIKVGDKILSVNGKEVDNWMQVTDFISGSEGAVDLTVLRDGQIKELSIEPRQEETKDIFGNPVKRRLVGIAASDKVKIIREGPIAALYKGVHRTISLTFLIIKGFAYTILGRLPAKEAIAGPIGIYFITSKAAEIGLVAVLSLMGSISVSLTIINLVPFPVLDGGHIFFFFLEKIRRRPLSQRAEDVLTRFGMAVLFMLIALVLYNDVLRFVLGNK